MNWITSACILITCFSILNSCETQNHPGVQWKVTELSFTSSKSYQDSFRELDLDVEFTHADGTLYKVPAFWNGGDCWKVRFAPPLPGKWVYKTLCTDESNAGLHKLTGEISCMAYQGDLEIYKHGFVKTESSKRYFSHADGTPFFYMGDTHWNFPVNTLSNLKTIIDKRVEQGFTVIQSEPIGAGYILSDGLSEEDISKFSKLDERFKYVADKGLVHANAQLFFVAELGRKRKKYPDAYLEKLCRYWVARYAAFPVMWTTAQECDNDYYHDSGRHMHYDSTNNPWKLVAQYIHQYDPYKHPLTAHMENTNHVVASNSSFRDLSCHTWFGAQWHTRKNGQLNFDIPKDYWNNGQGKPTVNYEGQYDHLWTLEFGARTQGWTAYLNGMFGQGYGAIDIWLYNSSYQMDEPSFRDGITITVEDKSVRWNESLEFPAAYQLGYMRKFFSSINWWKLVPRFDDPAWFSNEGSWYSIASIGSDFYVAYFYNTKDQKTGTLRNLENTQYAFQWFNPASGVYEASETVSIENGTYAIGDKPTVEDWVLLVQKEGAE